MTAVWVAPVVLTLGAGIASADAASGRPITPDGETPPQAQTVTDRPSGSPTQPTPPSPSSPELQTTAVAGSADAGGSASASSAHAPELARTGADVGSMVAVGAMATAAGAALVVAARERSAEAPER